MAKADWTPIGIGEAQLEHCFGWASPLFGAEYEVKENSKGLAPFIVETKPRFNRTAGCVAMMPVDEVVAAMQGTTSRELCRYIQVPRWANMSRFSRALRKSREAKRQAAKAEAGYIVEHTARTKKATELFFDQGA